MPPILLIHGAWHGAWCWDRLIPALEARGRRASAIDLPSAGEDPTPPESATLEMWSDRVVAELEALGEPALLVGHSMGGLSITQAAERAPERVAKLIYLCAYLPRDGETLASLSRTADPAEMLMRMVYAEDRLTVTVADETIRPAFYGDCSDEDLAFARARLKPLPLQPIFAPVRVTPQRYGRVPRAYIECTDDHAIPLALQRAMADAAEPIERRTLDTSHSPFFSAPDRLANILAAL
jgi:pimeloyl-ACP methyl ester carboxylesterase